MTQKKENVEKVKKGSAKKEEEGLGAAVVDTIDRDKSFADRPHGRTHDSPRTKVTPRTL